MSDVFYPVGLVRSVRAQNFSRVLSDEFEAGNVNTRRLWSAQNLKRRLGVQHAPLTSEEFAWLKGFHAKRDGQYDYFWFRDNVNRGGNIKARYAGPLDHSKSNPNTFDVGFDLEEAAPVRQNPDILDIYEAIAAIPPLWSEPLLWWDANREIYYEHLGVQYNTFDVYDHSGNGNAGVWQAGNLIPNNIYGQWQDYFFNATQWAKTAGNFNISGTQPACTIFLICKAASSAAQRVLFSVGTKGTGQTLGIQLTAANNFAPYIGGSEAWSTTIQANSPVSTYRSLAVVWSASSNTANMRVNAVALGPESMTRSYVAGPASIGAASDGTAGYSGYVAQILVFNAALTTTQIKALHNLFAYQYGLALVP
jgi:hypothetical protein